MDKISRHFAQLVRKKLKDNTRKIILFGSHARGDFTEGSDYDILIVVNHKDKKIQNIVLEASVEILNKYDALIGSIICDESEWQQKQNFPLGLNILREGVEI